MKTQMAKSHPKPTNSVPNTASPMYNYCFGRKNFVYKILHMTFLDLP